MQERPGLAHTYPEIHMSTSSIPESTQQPLSPFPNASPIFPQPNILLQLASLPRRSTPRRVRATATRHAGTAPPPLHLEHVNYACGANAGQNMWKGYAGSRGTTSQLLCIVTKRLFGNFQGCIGVNEGVWAQYVRLYRSTSTSTCASPSSN
ncbi:hypothetical protein J3E71DRAFT_402313 [Bipolaris maydis]|nr:hypothetical protein J3E73DRAFT_422950 [Bipolaris maydis]KAJ6278157.1 hypothetical protein J3E71DRAFT_402313 [Bipolaris maydis]